MGNRILGSMQQRLPAFAQMMAFLTLAVCVSLLMVPTAAAANTNGRAWKGDAHAGDQCIPEWQNQTITGLPVHFSAKNCSASSSSHMRYLSSDVVPARPRAGEVVWVTNHFWVDDDLADEGISLNIKMYGNPLLPPYVYDEHNTLKMDTDIATLCLGVPPYTYGGLTPKGVWMSGWAFEYWIDVFQLNICPLQCPTTKGPLSIRIGYLLDQHAPEFMVGVPLSFEFTGTSYQKGTDLFCMKHDFGLSAPVDAAQANRTAQVMVV